MAHKSEPTRDLTSPVEGTRSEDEASQTLPLGESVQPSQTASSHGDKAESVTGTAVASTDETLNLNSDAERAEQFPTRPGEVDSTINLPNSKQRVRAADPAPTSSEAGTIDLGASESRQDRAAEHRPSSVNFPQGIDTEHALVRSIEGGVGSRHTVTRFLAEGGLGKVFVALDNELNREVVLKTLRLETLRNPEAKQRFLKEAQINSQLEHPNIVPIYQACRGDGDDSPYYTMKYIRGNELTDLIREFWSQNRKKRVGSLQLHRLLQLFVNTCYAISYAHNRGVIHRDLKPANIAVGEFGELQVLDWGLAKVLGENENEKEIEPDEEMREVHISPDADPGMTLKGRIMGTPGYMSPEQASGDGDRIDQHADIYALGAILFQILTGEPPHKPLQSYRDNQLQKLSKRYVSHTHVSSMGRTSFSKTRENTRDLLDRIKSGAVPIPSDIAPSVPPALESICRQAMAIDIPDRYHDAADIASEIERWLADEEVQAHRDSWFERIGRWMRKNRVKVQAALITLSTITMVAVAASFLVNHARLNEKQAKELEATARLKELAAKQQVASLLKEARNEVTEIMNQLMHVTERYPQFQPQAAELLQGRVTGYEKLIGNIKQQLQNEDDPALQTELGRLYIQLGFLQNQFGLLDDASRSYEESLAIWTGLKERNVSDGTVPVNMARTLRNLADISYEQNQPVETIRARIDEGLATLAVSNRSGDAIETRALLLADRGVLESRLENKQQAESAYREALALIRSVPKSDDDYRMLLTHAKLANRYLVLLSQWGRNHEAIEFYQQEIQPLELSINRHPQADVDPRSAWEVLGTTAVDWANELRVAGHTQESLQTYPISIDRLGKLVERVPDSATYLVNLATAHLNYGRMLQQVSDHDASVAQLEKAIQHAGIATNYVPLIDYLAVSARAYDSLAESVAMQGRIEEAAQYADESIRILEHAREALGPNHARSVEFARLLAQAQGTRVLVSSHDPKFEKAEDLLFKARENYGSNISDSSPDDHVGLIRLRLVEGYYLSAREEDSKDAFAAVISLLNKAIELFPDRPELRRQLAVMLSHCPVESLRDPTLSSRISAQLVSDFPDNGWYHFTNALSSIRSNDHSLAIQRLERADETGVNDGTVHLLRSILFAARGDMDLARKSFAIGGKRYQSSQVFDWLARGLHTEAAGLLGDDPENSSDSSNEPQDQGNK